MASKIYKKGVFLVIEDTVSGVLKELNTADVQIVKRNANLDVYDVLVFGVSQLKVNLADIQNESGASYSENDWDVFRFNEVGVVNTNNTSAVTTTTVDITSAQILAMGSTPIELLPAAGAGKYYDVEKIILEYTHSTTAYSLVDDFLRVTYSTLGYSIDKQVITAGLDVICIADSTYSISVGNQLFSQALLPNASVDLTTDNGGNPTLGDGTIRAIVTYTLRTFGA